MTKPGIRILAGLAVGLLLVAPLASGAKRDREIDHIVTRPDLASIRMTAVAVLPAASFDQVHPAERHAEAELMRRIRSAGYRWVSATTTRDRLRESGGDSLVRAAREAVLKSQPFDSTFAADLCVRLRVNGLISILLERATQISIQSDQSGKPSTTVQARAILMDSLGHAVWLASGSEFVEGLELHAQPGGAVGGGGNLSPTVTQMQVNAPDWPLAFAPLFERWAPSFPPKSALNGGSPPDSTTR